MTSKKVYQYSKIPMALLQVKFCKESWSSLSNQFFVCQKRLVLCQSLRCSFNFRVPRTAVVENPKAGSDPMYSTAAACLANLSASSLSSLSLSLWSGLSQSSIARSVWWRRKRVKLVRRAMEQSGLQDHTTHTDRHKHTHNTQCGAVA